MENIKIHRNLIEELVEKFGFTEEEASTVIKLYQYGCRSVDMSDGSSVSAVVVQLAFNYIRDLNK